MRVSIKSIKLLAAISACLVGLGPASASESMSTARSAILPLLSAPADLYSLLKANTLVQIIADVEVADSAISNLAKSNANGMAGRVLAHRRLNDHKFA